MLHKLESLKSQFTTKIHKTNKLYIVTSYVEGKNNEEDELAEFHTVTPDTRATTRRVYTRRFLTKLFYNFIGEIILRNKQLIIFSLLKRKFKR